MGTPFRFVPHHAEAAVEGAEGKAGDAAEAAASPHVDIAADMQRLRAAAETAGYEEGLRRGIDKAMQQVSVAITEAIAETEVARARVEADLARGAEAIVGSVLKAGVHLAEALAGGPLEFDRSALHERLLTEARSEACEGEGLVIVCISNPATLAGMRSTLPADVVGVEDTGMKPGGFIVELRRGDGGSVVDRWDASIERIMTALHRLRSDGWSS